MKRETVQAVLHNLSIIKSVFININADLELINSLNTAINCLKAWDRLYRWLNDMRFAIAPDEFITDANERHDRQMKIDLIDRLMGWMIEQEDKQ